MLVIAILHKGRLNIRIRIGIGKRQEAVAELGFRERLPPSSGERLGYARQRPETAAAGRFNAHDANRTGQKRTE